MNIPCVACGAQETFFLFRTHDRHYNIPGEFDIVRCARCGLVRLDPMPSDEQLAGFYADDYYAYVPATKRKSLLAVLSTVLRIDIRTGDPDFKSPGEFLDVGCGAGAYLRVMADRGWRVRGVEPSSSGSKAGQAMGFDIFHGTLLDAMFPDSSFDYVRSNHSFEHMTNPVEILKETHRILRSRGKLYIGIPNGDSFAFRLFGRYWWYMGVPLHTYTYSVKTIVMLLERSGFKIVKVSFNSNFWSLLGSLQIFFNRNLGEPSHEGRLVRSKILILLANIAEKFLDLLGQGDAIEVIAEKM